LRQQRRGGWRHTRPSQRMGWPRRCWCLAWPCESVMPGRRGERCPLQSMRLAAQFDRTDRLFPQLWRQLACERLRSSSLGPNDSQPHSRSCHQLHVRTDGTRRAQRDQLRISDGRNGTASC
jgi:hypothetical protein